MIDLLKQLCSLSGVSGDEGDVRDFILRHIKGNVDSLEVDRLGNIIAFKKGRRHPEKKLMFSAHMDEVGIIVINITDDGYLKFATVGGIDSRLLLGKHVCIGHNRIPGIIGCKAVHLMDSKEKSNVLDVPDMYVDIGVDSKEAAKSAVDIGDTGVFDSLIEEIGNGYIRGKAIDDRIGCCVLMTLIRQQLPVDCYFVFTVQEEVGCRGALGSSFRLSPDIAFIVEGTTAADLPTVDRNKVICRLGDGVVVPFMDRGTIYDKGLYKFITSTANKHGIPWQTKTYVAGGTDASAIQRSGKGVKVAGFAVPIRYIHSPLSVANIADCENMYKLIFSVLEEIE